MQALLPKGLPRIDECCLTKGPGWMELKSHAAMSSERSSPLKASAMPASAAASASRTSGISVRLWKVTDSTTSFEDPDAKEALRIVSERYSAPFTKSRKGKERAHASDTLQSGLHGEASDSSELFSESDTDDDEESSGWIAGGPSGVPRRSLLDPRRIDVGSATRARTELKRDIEGKLVDTSLKFLDAFGKVDEVGRRASGSHSRLTPQYSVCKYCAYIYKKCK